MHRADYARLLLPVSGAGNLVGNADVGADSSVPLQSVSNFHLPLGWQDRSRNTAFLTQASATALGRGRIATCVCLQGSSGLQTQLANLGHVGLERFQFAFGFELFHHAIDLCHAGIKPQCRMAKIREGVGVKC